MISRKVSYFRDIVGNKVALFHCQLNKITLVLKSVLEAASCIIIVRLLLTRCSDIVEITAIYHTRMILLLSPSHSKSAIVTSSLVNSVVQ